MKNTLQYITLAALAIIILTLMNESNKRLVEIQQNVLVHSDGCTMSVRSIEGSNDKIVSYFDAKTSQICEDLLYVSEQDSISIDDQADDAKYLFIHSHEQFHPEPF